MGQCNSLLCARTSGSSLRRLCVHFDINETILLGDPAGGDTFEESLNKILAKVAYVKAVPAEEQKGGRWPEWVWHDGSPLDPDLRTSDMPPPPLLPDTFADPPGCKKLYNVKELKKPFAKSFTHAGSPGVVYRPEYERLLAAMRWPTDVPVDSRLCSSDGYYACLPAFFHTLSSLKASGRPFSVVLRTFGTDLPRVQAAINAFVEGKHPLHAGVRCPELRLCDERMWRGRYSSADGSFTLQPYDERGEGRDGSGSSTREAAGFMLSEVAMLDELQGDAKSLPRVSAVQDDYEWWDEHGNAPSAGKPLWLTLDSHGKWRHIFFDDNIHNDPDDSIVAVRARAHIGDDFLPVSGAATVRLQGSVLKKVPTIRPILDKEWFLQQIEECEAQLDELMNQGEGAGSTRSLAAELGLDHPRSSS